MDWRGPFILAVLFGFLLGEVSSAGLFVPSSLSASVLQLCNSLKNRTRCPTGTCKSSTKVCSENSDCPCQPTRMEICCHTSTEGTGGCCVSVPLPLAIIGITSR